MMKAFMPKKNSDRQRKRPLEIVVSYEGFGAGPGMGWFIELSFVESDNGSSFSVYKRTDERVRQLAPVQKPLTWRRVAQFVLRRKSMEILDDSGGVGVRGLEPWQCNVIACALHRRSFTSFLLGLPDDDIQSLYSRLGDLLSEEADEFLPDLAEAVEEAGLRRKSLVEIAMFVGAADPWDFEVLLTAIQPFRDAMKVFNSAHRVAQFITEHRINPAEAPFSKLTEYPRLESVFHRAQLFAIWLRLERKPQSGKIGSINISGSPIPVLAWILAGHVIDVFEALDDDHHSELEYFIAWFKMGIRTGGHPYRGHPMGRGLHETTVRLQQEVEEAARKLGFTAPAGMLMAPIPSPNPQSS